jgi:hypothetical protein
LSENGREEEKVKRASAEVRSFARKKKTLLLRESEKFQENETKRATALKTKRPFSTERRPTGETETDGRR